MQLACILGGGSGGKGNAAPREPPPAPAPCHPAQVCGLEGRFVVAYGGSNGVGVGGGAAAVAWPFVPYSPVQWQVASNVANTGGALADYARRSPAPPCPAGARLPRGGTGVFLPRAEAYRHAPNPPAKDGKAPKPRAWLHQREEAAAVRVEQQWPQNEMMYLQPLPQRQKATAAAVHACPLPEVALPQDWSYH
uniref:Uncharacterized protein n=1 Tax=Arundo donax TaxID=35708 RepID=A0A0A8Z368_ARUDO